MIVLSASAIASPHVGKEVERASSKRRPIITFKTDTAPLTTALEYFLSESQWVDVGADGTEAAFAKLITAVRRQLTAASTGKPATGWHDAAGIGATAASSGECAADSAIEPPPRCDNCSDRRHRGVSRHGQTLAVETRCPKKACSDHSPPTTPAAPTIPEKSVAVLPFVDMSEKKDQEYFSDGLSEELIDMLTKVPDLRVPARTSAFSFKGKSEDIPTIARKLLVAHVLEGSVRESGNHLRVTAQLVRADTGYHLWSNTYDRDLKDIFEVQDEIAAAVVQALKVSLLAGSSPRAIPTQNTARTHSIYKVAQSTNNYNDEV